ncbi:cyclophilin-like fold protein [Streptomyces sp. NPDC004082]|uniref:cyclophilin-like fold protein n=1 Tax=Streptomyces sp. NPDC005481 TaxID=3154881 RepID=UPI0033ACF159
MQIRISWPAGHLTAALDDTPTTQVLARALPLVSTARTWGEEVYFDTGVAVAVEGDARQVVAPGTVAFWTDGDALALPYGPTPISQGYGLPADEFEGECRLASPCNLLGRVEGDPRVLATVRDGDPVRVELVDERWSPPDAARTTEGNV